MQQNIFQIFHIDYGYIETIEKEFKDLLSKEKENIKPSEEKELISGIKHNIYIYSLVSLQFTFSFSFRDTYVIRSSKIGF